METIRQLCDSIEFRKNMKQAKLEYKNKMLSGNDSDAWEGLNRMMSRTRKYQALVSDNPATFANDLKMCYATFDNNDYRHLCDILCHVKKHTPCNTGRK